MTNLVHALLFLAVATVVHGVTVFRDWSLTDTTIEPDGYPRNAQVVNGLFPGPLLTANKSDTVVVNVQNNLFDPTMCRSTSIHWHGIFQPRHAYDDGPSFVTQCPISQNHSYPYTLALGDQTGTYWYHSHLASQYVDGIRGAIVIYDPNDPQGHMYDVDDESTVITFADWYHTPALNASQEYLNGGSEPVPDSGLINGIGRHTDGDEIPWARINVTSGKRYRFRLVSLSASGAFDISFSNHSMTVIEADGIAHEPYVVNSIPLLAGQRYSVIVTANQSADNYWIRATQTVINPSGNPKFNGTNNWAVLHYDGADDGNPTPPQPTGLEPGEIAFKEFNLVPLNDPAPPGGSDPADQVFEISFHPSSNATNNAWFVNGVQYQSPSVPTLLKIFSGASNDDDFDPSEITKVLEPNSVIEVSFIGEPGHPFHLHGHAFSVIQSASGGLPNYKNPPRRDVVESGFGPTGVPTLIRFRTDNPGPWFLHCHIDWHLVAGLALVFAEDPAGIRSGNQSVIPNPQWHQLCEIYNSQPEDVKFCI